MSTNHKKAIQNFIIETARFKKFISNIILYGSCARNEASKESDIDLLIVLDNQNNIKMLEPEINNIASSISLEFNLVISLVFIDTNYFTNRYDPFLINIRKEGQKIA